MLRAAGFIVQRYLLGRQTLLVPVPELAMELRVPARDAIGRQLYRHGIHAPQVTDFLATSLELHANDVVLDVGAGIGWYSLLVARIAPRGVNIHAFEPDPWMRGLLQENVSRNRVDNVTLADAAVGEDSRPAGLRLYGQRRRSGGGLLGPSRPELLEVPMVSLDDYCRAAGLEQRPVGFLKLSVEGFEYFALRGATETLGRCRALLTEYWPEGLEQAGSHPASMLDLLVELGFSPALLEAGGARPVLRRELLADERPRKIFWSRADARLKRTPVEVDHDALAI